MRRQPASSDGGRATSDVAPSMRRRRCAGVHLLLAILRGSATTTATVIYDDSASSVVAASVPPRRQPHWAWRWDTISTWAMPGFTTATERNITPAPVPHPHPAPPPAPPSKSGRCGWYAWWSDAGCRTWAAGSCQQKPWIAPAGHPSSSTLHQRYPNGSYAFVGTNLYCANPTIYMCGPNCTTTDADCRAMCDKEQPHQDGDHQSDGGTPLPAGSAGQMTRAEALYYSNFSIFSTQTWDVACEGGGVAVCANFNDCECLNATTGEYQGTWKADEEARMMEAARATRAFNPTQPYVPYAYFTVSQSHYAGQAPFNQPENGFMWLRDAAGRALNGTPALGGGPHMPAQGFGMESRLYDFSMKAARQYFLSNVMAPFMAAEECDGVIWDEVTWLLHNEGDPREYYSCVPDVPHGHECTIGLQTLGRAKAKAYRNGLLQMIAELSDYGIPRGKFPFYSTQTHLNFFPGVYREFSQVLSSHGGGRLWEFFCLHDEALFPEIGGLNSTCLHHVLTLQHEASLGIPAVVHAVFGALGHPRGPRDSVDFLLAAFLVACGEFQYVVVSPSNGWRLRPDGRDFALHDQYRQRLGRPLGNAVRNGTQFRRRFQHAQVFVDVGKARTANITWR